MQGWSAGLWGREGVAPPPTPVGASGSRSLVIRRNLGFSEVPISGTLGCPENFGLQLRDFGQFSTTCPGSVPRVVFPMVFCGFPQWSSPGLPSACAICGCRAGRDTAGSSEWPVSVPQGCCYRPGAFHSAAWELGGVGRIKRGSRAGLGGDTHPEKRHRSGSPPPEMTWSYY